MESQPPCLCLISVMETMLEYDDRDKNGTWRMHCKRYELIYSLIHIVTKCSMQPCSREIDETLGASAERLNFKILVFSLQIWTRKSQNRSTILLIVHPSYVCVCVCVCVWHSALYLRVYFECVPASVHFRGVMWHPGLAGEDWISDPIWRCRLPDSLRPRCSRNLNRWWIVCEPINLYQPCPK